MSASVCAVAMRVLAIKKAVVSYPTGNKSFAVLQTFPGAFTAEEADPFLMCDEFEMVSHGIKPEDDFPVGWHPHAGQDVLTYMREGYGRHADSLGNRETFKAPGIQWASVGSGIEHAEGGGTPKGENEHGFQIWVNVPSKHKYDDPDYGTHDVDEMPVTIITEGVSARVLAGSVNGVEGPYKAKAPIQMADYTVAAGATLTHTLPSSYDNAFFYLFKGKGVVEGKELKEKHVVRFDASDAESRTITINAGSDGFSGMLFTGKRINEPIAWHGPFVMNSDSEIQQIFSKYRMGKFPPKRTPWDYRNLSAFPKK